MFAFLRSIGLSPVEWSQAVKATGKTPPYVGEVLDAAFSSAQALVVLMTPDDEACLREQFRKSGDPTYEAKLTGQSRPNVLFEAGMAMGRSPERTILVELGELRPFNFIPCLLESIRGPVTLNNGVSPAARSQNWTCASQFIRLLNRLAPIICTSHCEAWQMGFRSLKTC